MSTVTRRLLTLTHKMKAFVAILALVAVAAADVSHLGQHPEANAEILIQEADVFPDQFRYIYQTSNGISGQETGVLKQDGKGEAAIVVEGSNSYTSPEGQLVQLDFTADENGYQPRGAHLPTPPPPQPIPEYILRALEYIRTHPAKPEPGQKY